MIEAAAGRSLPPFHMKYLFAPPERPAVFTLLRPPHTMGVEGERHTGRGPAAPPLSTMIGRYENGRIH